MGINITKPCTILNVVEEHYLFKNSPKTGKIVIKSGHPTSEAVKQNMTPPLNGILQSPPAIHLPPRGYEAVRELADENATALNPP